MSQNPYNDPYSTTDKPVTLGTGTGTGTGAGLGTGLSSGTGTYSTSDPHYISSTTGLGNGYSTTGYGTTGTTGYPITGTTGTTGIGTTGYGKGTGVGQQPLTKKKHRPQSRSSSSSSSDRQKQGGQKKSLGQKIKQIPQKVMGMMPGHHNQPSTTGGGNVQ